MKNILLFLVVLLAGQTKGISQTPLSQEEISILLERHNSWRTEVGIKTNLEWSDELALHAEDWAKKLKRKGCKFEHRPNNEFGENLFMGTTGFYTALDVVDAWGNEKSDYNYSKNKCKPGKMCGHYTQIVWETTTKVGCAKITCGGNDIWVCNYDPPGNWVGKKPY